VPQSPEKLHPNLLDTINNFRKVEDRDSKMEARERKQKASLL
jgi:hypothetical protein